MTVAVMGATGKLGNFVIKHLLKKLPSKQIVAVICKVYFYFIIIASKSQGVIQPCSSSEI